jgi:type I restriction enzyme S subunit
MSWATSPLRIVSRRVGGGTPSRENKTFWNGDIPWFTVADLLDVEDIQKLSSSRETITSAGLKHSAAKLIPEGAVVFSSRVVVGKVGIAQNALATNQDFSSFLPSPDLDREFLAYFLIKVKGDLRGHQRGATIKGVTTQVLDSLEIPLPPLKEQRRIVARIKECMERVEEIENLRDAAQTQQARLAESLVETQLANLDGEDVSLADVCHITSRLIDPRDAQFRALLHVGGANIESKTGRLIDLKTAAEENLKSGKFVFNQSVVLYNKIRPYLMKVARPDFSGLCSADMYPLDAKKGKVTRDFLFYILMSRRFTDYAIAGSNRAGMPKVNRERLFAYHFKLPSLAVQLQICERLDLAIATAQSLGQEMISITHESANLRESILRKAFAGEL